MKTALSRTKLLASALIVIAVIGGATYYLLGRNADTELLEDAEYSEAQLNEGGVDGIRDLPLAEAKKRLNYLILDMRDSLNRIAVIESMRLEIGPATPTPGEPQAHKELSYDKPFMPFPDQQLKAALTTLKQTPQHFQQVFFDNGSGLNLDVETIRDTLKLGALPDQESTGSYQIQTVHFRDGTQQPFAEVVLEDANNEEEPNHTSTELKVNKPVERISVALHYQAYPGFKKLLLDLGQHFAGFEFDGRLGTVGGDQHLSQGLRLPAHRFERAGHQAAVGVRVAVMEAVVADLEQTALGA